MYVKVFDSSECIKFSFMLNPKCIEKVRDNCSVSCRRKCLYNEACYNWCLNECMGKAVLECKLI